MSNDDKPSQNANKGSIPTPDDELGWEAFFREHDPLIRSVVTWSKWNLAFDRQDDLFQTIRVELIQSLQTFEYRSSLPNFIKRIASRRCIDEIRRKVRKDNPLTSISNYTEGGQDLDLPDKAEFDPIQEISRVERGKAIRGLVASMDQGCRDVVERFYFAEQSYESIARNLGIAKNTVGSRLSRCLSKLYQLIADHPILAEDSPSVPAPGGGVKT